MHPAGSTCGGRSDCAGDQTCVAQVCRYRRTSVAGEVLAVAAEGQRTAGDARSAWDTYQQAIAAFQAAQAPSPPEVLCAAALAALELDEAPDERERGARAADVCLRGSLPGNPVRGEVLQSLARLRYEGLALSAFDQAQPESFFSESPSRPMVDAIEVAVVAPAGSEPGRAELMTRLQGDDARRALADCFLQDWEHRHEREAHAPLLLKMTTRLRDMGNFEIYVGRAEVQKTTDANDGFEACAATVLSAFVEEGPRLNRAAIWQVPIEASARLL